MIVDARGRRAGISYLVVSERPPSGVAGQRYRASGGSLRLRVAGRIAMLLGALSFVGGTLVLTMALQDLIGVRGTGGGEGSTPPACPLGVAAWMGGTLLTGLLSYVGTRLHRRGRQLATRGR